MTRLSADDMLFSLIVEEFAYFRESDGVNHATKIDALARATLDAFKAEGGVVRWSATCPTASAGGAPDVLNATAPTAPARDPDRPLGSAAEEAARVQAGRDGAIARDMAVLVRSTSDRFGLAAPVAALLIARAALDTAATHTDPVLQPACQRVRNAVDMIVTAITAAHAPLHTANAEAR